MKTYFKLFKKAGRYVKEGLVKIDDVKLTNERDTYYIKVNGYDVTLHFFKTDKSGVWQREWNCTCVASSIRIKELCAHIVAAQTFLCLY